MTRAFSPCAPAGHRRHSLAAPARAQMTESELVMRLNRLEGQVRQLTGTVEQLQYRNQQLEQQLAARGPQAAPQDAGSRRARRCRCVARAVPQQQAYRAATGLSAAAGLPAAAGAAASLSASGTAPRACSRPSAGAAMPSIRTRTPMRRVCRARSASPARSRRLRRRSPRPPRRKTRTSRRMSALRAGVRPARRSISGSWLRKPRTIRRHGARCARSPVRCPRRRRATPARPAPADGDGAEQHPEGRVRPRVRTTCSARTTRSPTTRCAPS